jgi:hypothetical protein
MGDLIQESSAHYWIDSVRLSQRPATPLLDPPRRNPGQHASHGADRFYVLPEGLCLSECRCITQQALNPFLFNLSDALALRSLGLQLALLQLLFKLDLALSPPLIAEF